MLVYNMQTYAYEEYKPWMQYCYYYYLTTEQRKEIKNV